MIRARTPGNGHAWRTTPSDVDESGHPDGGGGEHMTFVDLVGFVVGHTAELNGRMPRVLPASPSPRDGRTPGDSTDKAGYDGH
jgi:hypothetical protein